MHKAISNENQSSTATNDGDTICSAVSAELSAKLGKHSLQRPELESCASDCTGHIAAKISTSTSTTAAHTRTSRQPNSPLAASTTNIHTISPQRRRADMPSRGRVPVASGTGGKQRWSTDEMHILRMLNQESEFGSNVAPSDQPQLFSAIFPYMRGHREYDESQLRDTWKHCHSKGRGKAWLRAVRPNKVEKDEYSEEEKESFKGLRGWVVAAAEAIGLELTGIDGLEVEAASQEFLDQMEDGLAKAASGNVDDEDDEDDEHADETRTPQDHALPSTSTERARNQVEHGALQGAQEDEDMSDTIVVKHPPKKATAPSGRRGAQSNRLSVSALQESQQHISRSPAIDRGQGEPPAAPHSRLGKRTRSAEDAECQATSDAPLSSQAFPATKRARRTAETPSVSTHHHIVEVDASKEDQPPSKTIANKPEAYSGGGSYDGRKGIRSALHPSTQTMEPNNQQPAKSNHTQPQDQTAQDGPAEPLPMVHWSHLTFQPDGIFYRPTRGHSALSTEEGFVNSESAMYRYGGPVVSLNYVPGPKQPAHEARKFDAMVCLKDMCNTCRPEHPLVVAEHHLQHSPFFGLPAVHLIDVCYTQGNVRFSQKQGRVVPSQDGWLFSAKDKVSVFELLFSDGYARKVAVCAGVDCKTCQSQSKLFSHPSVGQVSDKPQAQQFYPGYQSLIPIDSDTPRLLKSDIQHGIPLMMVHCRDVQMISGNLIFTPRAGGIATDNDGYVPVDHPTFKSGGPTHIVQVPSPFSQTGYGEAHLQLCAKERCLACTVPPDNDALPESLLGPGAPVVHHIDCHPREDGLLQFAPQHARDYTWIQSLEDKDVVFGDGKLRRARICAGPYGPMCCGVCRAESGYVPPQQGTALPMVHSRHLGERDGVTLFAPPPPGLEGNEDMDGFGLVKQDLPLYQHGGHARRVCYTVGGQAVDVQVCDLMVCRGCNPGATGVSYTGEPRPPVVRRRFCTLRHDGLLEFTPEEGGNDTAAEGMKESEVVFADGGVRMCLIADDSEGL